MTSQYAIPGRVEIATGPHDAPTVLLTHPSGASAEADAYGAHVVSWKDPSGEELLYMSPKAIFRRGKAMRGGIPVCWPQFGLMGKLPQHGFARFTEWRIAGSAVGDAGETCVSFELKDDADTRKLWPHSFLANLTLWLDKRLTLTLNVRNVDKAAFDFTGAFHTYFRVSDIRHTRVHGLQGARILQAVWNAPEREQRAHLDFRGLTDTVYAEVAGNVEIEDVTANRRMHIAYRNLPDIVVWNPWIENSRKMEDLADDSFEYFVCVENVVCQNPVRLEPGARWEGQATLTPLGKE